MIPASPSLDAIRMLGPTDLTSISVVITTQPLSWAGRQEGLALLGAAWADAGGVVRASPAGFVLELLVHHESADLGMLVNSIGGWRGRIVSADVSAVPARSLHEIALALNLGERGEQLSAMELARAPAFVLVTGGRGRDEAASMERLDRLRTELAVAVGGFHEFPAGEPRVSPDPADSAPTSTWLQIPGLPAPFIRWYRLLPDAASAGRAVDRSVANVVFGGGRRSRLPTRLRSELALSYGPTSALTRIGVHDAIVIDVPTSQGLEEEVNTAVAQLLRDTAAFPIAEREFAAAQSHLLGRMVVDFDSVQNANTAAVAALDGSDHWGAKAHAQAVGAELTTLDRVADAFAEVFSPGYFHSLVLSGEAESTSGLVPQ